MRISKFPSSASKSPALLVRSQSTFAEVPKKRLSMGLKTPSTSRIRMLSPFERHTKTPDAQCISGRPSGPVFSKMAPSRRYHVLAFDAKSKPWACNPSEVDNKFWAALRSLGWSRKY